MDRFPSLLLRSLVLAALLAGRAHAQAAPAAAPHDSTQAVPAAAPRDSAPLRVARKSQAGAAILGLTFAGSGHWYAGERGRGALVAAVYFPCALIAFSGRTDRVAQTCGVVTIGTLAFSVIDGVRAVRRFNMRQAAAAPPASPSAASTQAAQAPRTPPGRSPLLGVAVADPAAHWCAMFAVEDTVPVALEGDRLTIVWADSTSARASAPARVRSVRRGSCRTFGPDAAGAANAAGETALAYELALDDSAGVAGAPVIAHVVPGTSAWRIGPHGWAYGDLDGDGVDEIARACTSHEGLHLTLWRQPTGSRPQRIARYYHHLGYDVMPSCTTDETRAASADPV